MIEEIAPHRMLIVSSEADLLDRAIVGWLALPQASRDVGCPGCGGRLYGAVNPAAPLMVYRCHSGCARHFRGLAGDHYQEDWLMKRVFGQVLDHVNPVVRHLA